MDGAPIVADHYAVTRDFVYAHANELGGIRLGTGPRPRLRFDPATVRERWAHVNETPAVTRERRRPGGNRRERLTPVDLIPFERDPWLAPRPKRLARLALPPTEARPNYEFLSRWYVVVDVGPGLDGRRRQKWHGGYRTSSVRPKSCAPGW